MLTTAEYMRKVSGHNGVILRALLKVISSNTSAAEVSVEIFTQKSGSRTQVKYLQEFEKYST